MDVAVDGNDATPLPRCTRITLLCCIVFSWGGAYAGIAAVSKLTSNTWQQTAMALNVGFTIGYTVLAMCCVDCCRPQPGPDDSEPRQEEAKPTPKQNPVFDNDGLVDDGYSVGYQEVGAGTRLHEEQPQAKKINARRDTRRVTILKAMATSKRSTIMLLLYVPMAISAFCCIDFLISKAKVRCASTSATLLLVCANYMYLICSSLPLVYHRPPF